ncbi:MAG: aspartate kinase [Bdellovibrionaceae bacterium]|nr:aspartate kinase [Pseudobdellovibrionaceae bacterium]
MENLVVQKYGGSSLSSVEKIQSIAKNLSEIAKKQSLIVVVSAMGKATDNLLNMAYEISDKPEKRELDMLLTSGERIAMSLLSIALNELGVSSVSFTGSQAGILTSNQHNSASIVEIKPFRVSEVLKQKKVAILAGFQGVNPTTKEITTLGRGGSDTTAVYLADHFKAPCEIYKDVEGVCSADPNQVSNVTKYDEITYDELLSMIKWGNPILHRYSIGLAKDKKVQLSIKKSLSKNTGTQIVLNKKTTANKCLSIESQALVFSIPCSEIKHYQTIKANKKLFTLYDLFQNDTSLLITGEKADLQCLKKTLRKSINNLSTVSFIFSNGDFKVYKKELISQLSKQFPSIVDWVDESLSLTAVIPFDLKTKFLNQASLFLKDYHSAR